MPLLFLSPIGIANNGDFYRIMLAGGIDFADPGESYQDKYFGYFHAVYHYGPFSVGSYISSQIVVVFAAGMIGRLMNADQFDIRILSFLYSVLYITALYVLVKYNKERSILFNTVLIASLSLVFLDIGYVAYFNSFFGESVTLIFIFAYLWACACLNTLRQAIHMAVNDFLRVGCLPYWYQRRKMRQLAFCFYCLDCVSGNFGPIKHGAER